MLARVENKSENDRLVKRAMMRSDTIFMRPAGQRRGRLRRLRRSPEQRSHRLRRRGGRCAAAMRAHHSPLNQTIVFDLLYPPRSPTIVPFTPRFKARLRWCARAVLGWQQCAARRFLLLSSTLCIRCMRMSYADDCRRPNPEPKPQARIRSQPEPARRARAVSPGTAIGQAHGESQARIARPKRRG